LSHDRRLFPWTPEGMPRSVLAEPRIRQARRGVAVDDRRDAKTFKTAKAKLPPPARRGRPRGSRVGACSMTFSANSVSCLAGDPNS
jgi:hypothetical protein